MKYSNNESILKSEGTPGGLRSPGKELKKGNLLNAGLLCDNVAFSDLFDLWIAPGVELMKNLNENEPDDNVLSFFYENAEEEKCNSFLNRFTDFIIGKKPYNANVWPMCPYEAICAEVDEELPDTACHMKLRIKIVCILLAAVPKQSFAEGVNWSAVFHTRGSKDTDLFEVSDGMKFSLKFDNIEELFPRTLHNNNDEPCHILIDHKDASYRIVLPPFGFIRAVFGNKNCDYLVSVKGNISFNGSGTRNAIVQLTKEKCPALFMYHKQYREPYELEVGGTFVDAAADGQGGAVALAGSGLYYTRNAKLVKNKELPIRVYGAGTFWAQHYADGTLECNVHWKGGLPVNKAVAVIENGDLSLMIRDESGAWDCVGGVAKEITDDMFVKCMMERFLCDDLCESVKSSLMHLCVLRDGKLGVK